LRLPKAFLVIRAVDIDVALVGIDAVALVDARFGAAKPEDSGGHEVVRTVRIDELAKMETGILARFENDAGWRAAADLFGDEVEAGRCS